MRATVLSRFFGKATESNHTRFDSDLFLVFFLLWLCLCWVHGLSDRAPNPPSTSKYNNEKQLRANKVFGVGDCGFCTGHLTCMPIIYCPFCKPDLLSVVLLSPCNPFELRQPRFGRYLLYKMTWRSSWFLPRACGIDATVLHALPPEDRSGRISLLVHRICMWLYQGSRRGITAC